MTTLSVDFETRATVDLRKTGVYPYAMHPDTDIWCMAWAFDDEEPAIWLPADGLPERILEHIESGGEMRAWNSQFERVIWQHVLSRYTGWHATPKLEQWTCTMAEASAMALPRSLDACARVLGVAPKKDEDGYGLMMRMTRPRAVRDDGTVVWWTDLDKLERLYAYCMQDVRVERAISKVVRRLSPAEREIYLLDQRINDRGVRIDRSLILAARGVVAEGLARANAALAELSGDAINSVTDHRAMAAWVGVTSVDKAAVRGMLTSDTIAPEVRAALTVRSEAGRSSVAKLESMLEVAGDDDRMRGLLLYHGAHTGRWTGKLVQPQNFPKGEVPNVERYIPDVLAGAYDTIDLCAPPISVVASLLRAMLVASGGCDLLSGDYTAIEARILNWLAGQDDVTALFAAGEDVYAHMADRLGTTRTTGKFAELGCGFGMGAEKAVASARDFYRLTLSPDQAKALVVAYRESHPHVVWLWQEVNDGCIRAVDMQRTAVDVADGRVKIASAGGYLYIRLPSGRPLCYPAPRIEDVLTPWNETRPAVTFGSVFGNQWIRETGYGGKFVENIVSGIARDVMAEGMLRVEKAGYDPILSVHDEVVSEAPKGFGGVEEYVGLLAEVPVWAQGCPVAAEGWRGDRYRK